MIAALDGSARPIPILPWVIPVLLMITGIAILFGVFTSPPRAEARPPILIKLIPVCRICISLWSFALAVVGLAGACHLVDLSGKRGLSYLVGIVFLAVALVLGYRIEHCERQDR